MKKEQQQSYFESKIAASIKSTTANELLDTKSTTAKEFLDTKSPYLSRDSMEGGTGKLKLNVPLLSQIQLPLLLPSFPRKISSCVQVKKNVQKACSRKK